MRGICIEDTLLLLLLVFLLRAWSGDGRALSIGEGGVWGLLRGGGGEGVMYYGLNREVGGG